MNVITGAVMRAKQVGKGEDCDLDYVPNGVVILNEQGEVICVQNINALVEGVRKGVYDQIEGLEVDDEGQVFYHGHPVEMNRQFISLPTANTHCHTFQPPGVPGVLLDNGTSPISGWLPQTLITETAVKREPALAEAMARRKFRMYLSNGITAGLEYTTSSFEAAKIVLNVAEEMGLKDRVKVGYVCMNQNVNFDERIDLETSVQEALAETRKLLEKYGDRIVVIDRFPIAVSSPLRKGLVALAKKFGVLYETHFDESQREMAMTKGKYNGKSILDLLIEDGVLDTGMKVGLAHAIHVDDQDLGRIKEKIDAGCELYIRACPNSNAQLNSHMVEDGDAKSYVPFPLNEWIDIGAKVTLGLDKGAGRGFNIMGEALTERGRPHRGGEIDYIDLLRLATINGLSSLGIDPKLQIKVGKKANFIVVKAEDAGAFHQEIPHDKEEAAALLIESAQNPENITQVYVEGRLVKICR